MLDDTKEASYSFKGTSGNKIVGKQEQNIEFFYDEVDSSKIGLIKEENTNFYELLVGNSLKAVYLCGDKLFFDFDGLDFYYSLWIEEHIKQHIIKNKKIVILVFNKGEDLILNLEKSIIVL